MRRPARTALPESTAAGPERDLVGEGLHPVALDDREFGRAAEVGDQELGEPALQRLERGVGAPERQRRHRDGEWGAGHCGQAGLVGDGGLRGRHGLLPGEGHETCADLLLGPAAHAVREIGLVGPTRAGEVLQRLSREARVERRQPVARVEGAGPLEDGRRLLISLGLVVRDAEGAERRNALRAPLPGRLQPGDRVLPLGRPGGGDQQQTH